MAMKHYHIAACVTPAGQINQLKSQDLDPQSQEMVEAFDGQVDPTFAAVLTQKPMMRMTSTAIAAVLTAVGIGGLAYDGGGAPVDLYWQPGVFGGTRDTTACVKASSALGMIALDSIEAAEGQEVEASLMAYCCSSDGVTAPLTLTSGVTLPSQSFARNMHTVGPVKLNGTLLDGVVSTSLKFGLQVEHDTESGGAYPTFVNIRARRPTITVRTRNVDKAVSLGLLAAQGNGTNKTTLFFRKMSATGRVPDATAQHVSLAASGGLIVWRRIPAQNGQPALAELDIPVAYNGTDAVIAVNTATAIA